MFDWGFLDYITTSSDTNTTADDVRANVDYSNDAGVPITDCIGGADGNTYSGGSDSGSSGSGNVTLNS